MTDVTMDVPTTAQPVAPAAEDAPEPAPETRGVWINGVAHVVPVGAGVSVPAEVAEVLEMQQTPNITAQSQGGSGVTTIDHTPKKEDEAPTPATTTTTRTSRTQTLSSTS